MISTAHLSTITRHIQSDSLTKSGIEQTITHIR